MAGVARVDASTAAMVSGRIMARSYNHHAAGGKGSARIGVEPGEHLVGRALDIGIVVGAGVVDTRLLEPAGDDAVIDHHRIAPRALAEAEMLLVDQHAHA